MTTKNGSGQVLASVVYFHDKADRRIKAYREDGTYWGYSYNLRGEVTGAQRYTAAETAINVSGKRTTPLMS